MKKVILLLIFCTPVCFLLASCNRGIDYFGYVSEYRSAVYVLKEDGYELKIYGVERETPYSLDGIKGETGKLVEVYFASDKNYNEVEVEFSGYGGEMSYLSVSRNYYLSFTGGELSGEKIAVTLNLDGKQLSVEAVNVASQTTIDGKTALKCVTEYDGESFEKLTQNGFFAGEIQVRLVYDDGCYYYVGVCDRDGNIHAYLLNGDDGRIIAERS